MSILPDLSTTPLVDLLTLRTAINAEIRKRGHARTATSLEGELMERVVANAYGGTLAPPITKSVDVLLPDGKGVQVKTRSLPRGDTRFWQFDDLEFELAVVVSMDRDSGEIIFAREIGRSEMENLAVVHAGGGYRLRMGKGRSAGVDVTYKLRSAYAALT